jgi:glycosyltransferase involved in cell wall biosynthesis
LTVEEIETRPLRTLAGATVLLAAPALHNDDTGRAVLDLAVALLRAGARALVSASGGGLVGELQALGGEWTASDFAKASILARRGTVEQLGRLVQSERVELVHAFGAAPARVAVAVLRRTATPLITSYLGAPPRPSWRRPPEDAQARGRIVIAASPYAAGLIAERHTLPLDHLAVVPPSIDTEWFDPADVRSDRVLRLREAWRIRPEARVVFAPGRLLPSRGQLALVDAVRLLVNGGLRGVVFVLAGDRTADPAYAKLVDDRIAAQGLGPLFRRVGQCTDMPAAYALADFVVLPLERAVTFSTILAEAQAMGRPVIASDLGALPDFMIAPPLGEPGPRTGWTAKPQDPLALAETLAAALATDRRTLQDISAEARRLSEMFSPEAVTAATLAIYESLLQT